VWVGQEGDKEQVWVGGQGCLEWGFAQGEGGGGLDGYEGVPCARRWQQHACKRSLAAGRRSQSSWLVKQGLLLLLLLPHPTS
jgi:hypothetical protein